MGYTVIQKTPKEVHYAVPMRSKSRKRAPQAEVTGPYWRLDLNCKVCQERTGRPHRIGFVYRRPHMEGIGTDMFIRHPLQAFEGQDDTKVRVVCTACQRRGGGSQVRYLDWSTLAYRVRLMEAQGIHSAGRAV